MGNRRLISIQTIRLLMLGFLELVADVVLVIRIQGFGLAFSTALLLRILFTSAILI